MTSTLWMGDASDIVETEKHKPIALRQSGTVEIESWVYNPSDGKAILTIITDDFRPEESLEFIAQEKANPNDFLNVNVLYQDRRDGYVLEVEGLSSQWDVMAVGVKINDAGYSETVSSSNETDDEEDTSNQEENPLKGVEYYLQADQRTIDQDAEMVALDRDAYEQRFVSFEIEDTQNEIENEQQSIQSAAEKKDRLYETIKELENDQSYQTGEEVDETQIEIDRLNKQIRDLDDDIYDHEMSIGMLEEKLQSLEEMKETVAASQ